MSNIVNFNEFKISDNIPIKEEDFNNLDNYKLSTLYRILKYDTKHQRKLLDNIFIRTTKENDIERFMSYLNEHNIYNYYVSSIAQSNNELYKIHLSLYFDNDLINELYGSKSNLAKQIYKYGKNYKLRNNTIDYLIQLSKLSCDYQTRAVIDKVVIRLSKKEIIDLELCRLREMLYGNYFFIIDNKYIKEMQLDKMTKVLKQVNKNYNNDLEDY